MIRIFIIVAFSLAVAWGASFIMSVPGSVAITGFGYQMQPSLGVVLFALILLMLLTIFVWAIIRRIFGIPALFSRANEKRKQRKGVDALSNAIIALQTGDPNKARQLAREARLKLEGNTAAQLLEAQANMQLGELKQARLQYREMIEDPKTAIAALSGLYEQARRQNREDAAVQFAQKAASLSPKLAWAQKAIFAHMAKQGDYEDALAQLDQIPFDRSARDEQKRLDAVLRTALAKELEETEPQRAITFANEALKKQPEFVPAALIAARLYISSGEVRKASGLLRRVWRTSAHPHIGELYIHAQTGASAVERLKRAKTMVVEHPDHLESAILLASAAIAAHEWSDARAALQPFTDQRATQKVCTLMAEVEQGDSGDQGKARAWLSRAVTAKPDATWIADGISADEWEPTSPLTGKLDKFTWTTPSRSVAKPTGTHKPAQTSAAAEPKKATAPEPLPAPPNPAGV
ncbi:heme biosynthesis protein HemY [Maritalea myrionectae]|uniref:HemY N-terminal domain-containing protein n=1 Tax=Maritalea myrionectae TaxID=454601 RepID=A0A2R4MAB2_9HYPH|nr:heme biosynthesis HemY N-terminal domain-containing protein [Maritalea myrionectae]AVX02952.1 hypothetical protein MXMO3_00406 [Maritalea myrionectae]